MNDQPFIGLLIDEIWINANHIETMLGFVDVPAMGLKPAQYKAIAIVMASGKEYVVDRDDIEWEHIESFLYLQRYQAVQQAVTRAKSNLIFSRSKGQNDG